MIEDKIQAEDALELISHLQAKISSAEADFNSFKAHFEHKILAAQKIFEDTIRDDREEILRLTESLRSFASSQLTGKKRSYKLPTATLSFHKQPPKFLFDDTETHSRDPKLLDFVKNHASDYLKTKTEEYVDWAALKRRLIIDDGVVFFTDTGEAVEDLRGIILPDKFEIKPN